MIPVINIFKNDVGGWLLLFIIQKLLFVVMIVENLGKSLKQAVKNFYGV